MECSICDRKIKKGDTYITYEVNVAIFPYWAYEIVSLNPTFKTKLLVRKKPLGYIGYIPLLSSIFFNVWNYFNKEIITIVECERCYDE